MKTKPLKRQTLTLVYVFFLSSLLTSFPALSSPPPFAQRVITLTPHLAEWVYSAGAGERLVGVVQHSDYPAAVLQIPVIGSAEGLNYEAILQLHPDLIFAWQQGTPPQAIHRLQSLGFNVISLSSESLQSIPNNIEKIGKLLGTLDRAKAERKRLQKQLTAIQTQYQKRAPVSVFYQLWDTPLITAGGDMFVSDAIQMCSGHNIFASVRALAPRVSPESVLMLNPSVLLLAGDPKKTQQWQAFWQQYPSLKAVQENHIFPLNADLYQRPTARFIDAIPALCQKIEQGRTADDRMK